MAKLNRLKLLNAMRRKLGANGENWAQDATFVDSEGSTYDSDEFFATADDAEFDDEPGDDVLVQYAKYDVLGAAIHSVAEQSDMQQAEQLTDEIDRWLQAALEAHLKARLRSEGNPEIAKMIQHHLKALDLCGYNDDVDSFADDIIPLLDQAETVSDQWGLFR